MFYFCKMQGTGNDFIIVDYINRNFEYSFKLLAEFMCNRHYGIGADGLIVVDKSEVADFKMRIFNRDGSEAEMCGNGIRCLAKYAYEHSIIKKEKFTIETKSGIKNIEVKVEGKSVLSIKVEMGIPVFDFDKIPVFYNCLEEDKEKQLKNNQQNEKQTIQPKKINIDGREFYPISIGNPHVVCFVENIENIGIAEIGKKIENYKYFPNKTNVEFVQIINKEKIRVRVWERGVGETISCGTGACASAIISNIIKSTNYEVIVDLNGEKLKIIYDKEKDKIYLEGDAKEVFSGNLKI